jgi:hypothetical protein
LIVKRIPVFVFVALGGILSLMMGVVMIVAQDETPAPVGEVTVDPLLLPSATATVTWTPTPTLMVVTEIVWPTATLTETPTATPTLTETPTWTPTWTETPTLVPTVTLEPTLLPSATVEPSLVPPTLEPTVLPPTTAPVKQEQPTQTSPQGYAPLPTTEGLATPVPVVPSAVPVQPTAVPIVPTQVPVEPIVIPTLPPVENPVQPTPVLLTTVVLTQPVEPTLPVVIEPTLEPIVDATVVVEPTVESLPLNGQINGQVLLPQRVLQTGMIVSLVTLEGQSTLAQTQTDEAGNFQFADVPSGNYVVIVQVSGALALQGTVSVTAGEIASLPLANLVVGDTNGDNVIDLADAAMVAANFNIQGAVPQADLNQDGVIDIRDLTLLGSYFGTEGPLQWQ